jgi:hypothetical protein
MFKTLLAAVALLLSVSAYAEKVSLLKIESDYFPNLSHEVGFDLSPNLLIERVYFNEANADPVFFTLDQLKADYVTVFRKFGFNLVKMKILKMDTPTSGVISLRVLNHAFFGRKAYFSYDVKLDENLNRYSIFDQRDNQEVTDLVVKTNFRAGVPVGIRDIKQK